MAAREPDTRSPGLARKNPGVVEEPGLVGHDLAPADTGGCAEHLALRARRHRRYADAVRGLATRLRGSAITVGATIAYPPAGVLIDDAGPAAPRSVLPRPSPSPPPSRSSPGAARGSR
jgi:hypothetical protein